MVNLDDIKQMLAEADEHTLTLYVNVDNAVRENQAEHPAWRIWLKNTLRDLGDQNRRAGGSAEETWNQIYQRVQAYFEAYQPRSRGLVVFAGASFQEAFELPLNVKNESFYGKPAVTPLLWMLDEYEPYLIALVDQEKARLFVAQLGAVEFEQAIEIDIEAYEWQKVTTLHSAGAGVEHAAVHGGAGKDDFQKTIDEQINHFYRAVVEQIQKAADRHGAERIILGGVEETMHAVKRYMPETLAQRVVAVLPASLRANPQQITEMAQSHALEYERQQELALVNQVIDFARSGGRGALGSQAVMEALDMQRVELLIMPWPMDDATLAAELPLRAFASGGNVELVHGEAADRLKQEGGLAARLYYSL